MQDKLNDYLTLQRLFKQNHFKLYLVGGTVRDFLLGKPLSDMDLVTDATPIQMHEFVDVDLTFAKWGSVRYKMNNTKFDITTLRKEKAYKDSRHPNKIKFVKSLKIDSKRRDFTINALYMDENFKVYDYVGGLKDLNKKNIRMIGNPFKRIKEDPLRILRAIRFSIILDFRLDPKLVKAIKMYGHLLKKIKVEKIFEEIRKLKQITLVNIKDIFKKYHILDYINVVE